MRTRYRGRPEDAIQRAVFQHLKARAAPGVFAFHVPNGGRRKPVEASIFKGLGVTPGVPDVILIRAGHAHALELKSAQGKLSPSQVECHEKMRAAGVDPHVAYGLDDALAWLEKSGFLKGRAA